MMIDSIQNYKKAEMQVPNCNLNWAEVRELQERVVYISVPEKRHQFQ
jgi:hypothetical protein